MINYDPAQVIQAIFFIVMLAVALKSIIGVHFPWERCSCCGKFYRDHKDE